MRRPTMNNASYQLIFPVSQREDLVTAADSPGVVVRGARGRLPIFQMKAKP